MPCSCESVRLSSACKINLGLRITGVRESGYHELDSIFYPLPCPRDDLTIRRTREGGIRVICNRADIISADNTLTRAYSAFACAVQGSVGIEVILQKRIPVGAGLGGGSGNAAVLLLWLNKENGYPLSSMDLAEIALSVGADTPFFLQNWPCRVKGTGEILNPVSRFLVGCWLILVCPDIPISTRQVYAGYDKLPFAPISPEVQNGLTEFVPQATKFPLFDASFRSDPCINKIGCFTNDLEIVVFAEYPSLKAIKAELLHLGAEAAGMSGSGSSLFGIFSRNRRDMARKAALTLRSGGHRVFLLHM